MTMEFVTFLLSGLFSDLSYRRFVTSLLPRMFFRSLPPNNHGHNLTSHPFCGCPALLEVGSRCSLSFSRPPTCFQPGYTPFGSVSPGWSQAGGASRKVAPKNLPRATRDAFSGFGFGMLGRGGWGEECRGGARASSAGKVLFPQGSIRSIDF